MVTEENDIRQNVFHALFDLIDTNKPNGWYCRSALSNVDSEFPVILLNPIKVESERWSKGMNDVVFTQKIDIMVHSDSNNSKLDEGRDNVTKTLVNETKRDTIYGTQNIIIEKVIDLGEPDIIEINDNTYLTASIMVEMTI